MNARAAAVNTQLLPAGCKYGTSAHVVRGARQAAPGSGAAPQPRLAMRPSSSGKFPGYRPVSGAAGAAVPVGGLDALAVKENI